MRCVDLDGLDWMGGALGILFSSLSCEVGVIT
jgi:hypothetical protein